MKSLSRLRKQVLSEWRGLDDPSPPKKEKKVSAVVEQVIKKLGLQARLGEEQIKTVWQEVVGDFLATHAEPIRLSGTTLLIKVTQPTIRYELERVWKKELLIKLQERFGKRTIQQINFSI